MVVCTQLLKEKPSYQSIANSSSNQTYIQNITPCQVIQFRQELGLEDDPANVQVDAAGLKKLFSHGIRRFCNSHGNVTARES